MSASKVSELIQSGRFTQVVELLLHDLLKTDDLNLDTHLHLANFYFYIGREDLGQNHLRVANTIANVVPNITDFSSDSLRDLEENISELRQNIRFNYYKNSADDEKETFGPIRQNLSSEENVEFINNVTYTTIVNFKNRISSISKQHGFTEELTGKIENALQGAHGEFLKMMTEIRAFQDWSSHIFASLNAVEIEGLYLEFGVYKGGSINPLAEMRPSVQFHGFDSFYGLHEEWNGFPVGHLNVDGEVPNVKTNVVLHPGLFNDTIPTFLDGEPGNVAFLHIDCDLYSSTKTIFDHLRNRIVPGTVIVFDEYIPDEYPAFSEFVEENSVDYNYLTRDFTGQSISVIID